MSNSTPWTPGPWKQDENEWREVYADEVGGYRLIAFAEWDEADARLISLAPEMAEWISTALGYLGSEGIGPIEAGEKLLARARGEALPPTGN